MSAVPRLLAANREPLAAEPGAETRLIDEAAGDLRGSLSAASDGPSCGTRFVLELTCAPRKPWKSTGPA